MAKYPKYFENIHLNENIIIISSADLFVVCNFLKNHIGSQFKVLSCISGLDSLQHDFRFSVIYDFLSIKMNIRQRVKLFVSELVVVPSLVFLYKNANWWEKEIWDMFGIIFAKHPDLRRILTDYGFEGYPLRKDFALYGYTESVFSLNQ